MRFVKPLKGFRFWKTLGMLFFSAAVLTGSLSSGNKAYALEEPILPPTMMMAAAPATPDNADLKPTKAKVIKKEVKAPVVKQELQEKKVSEEKAQKSAAAKVSKAASQDIEIVKTPEPESIDDSEVLALPKMPVEAVKPAADDDHDDFEVAPEKPVKDTKAKVEIVEPIKEIKVEQSEKTTVKVEDKPITKAEIKPSVEKPVEAKPAVKAEAKPVVKAEAKPVVKAEVKPAPVVKPTETKPVVKAKKAAKKAAVDESVVPQEWDWFSAPLIWVENEEGKRVLVADKTAPKIEIGEAKVVEPLPAFEESKAVLIAEELPLITSVKPAEPDFVTVAPVAAEAESEDVIALEEAPAVPEETVAAVDSEHKTAAEETVSAENEEKAECRPFVAAAEKMARIRRLREAEAEARGETIAKANRSERAERVRLYVRELLSKSEDSEKKIEEEPKTEIVPLAPPAEEIKAEKKAVKSMKKAQIEAENSKDDNRLAKVENSENITFEPYIGIFGSSASRRIDSAKWQSAWVR